MGVACIIAGVILVLALKRRDSLTNEPKVDPELYAAMVEQSKYTKAYKIVTDPLKKARVLALRAQAHAASSVPFAKRLLQDPRAAVHAQRVIDTFGLVRTKTQEAIDARDLAKAQLAAEQAEDARIECQGALLDALMASTDPIRTVQLPERPPTNCQVDDRPLKAAQRKLLAYLEAKGRELLAHMLTRYPSDRLTKKLNADWSRRVLAMSVQREAEKNAWMSTTGRGGCVYVNMSITGSVPRSLTRLIHELSHVCAGDKGMEPHTPLFYATERKLLRIATEDLGWTVENWCREACDLAQDPQPDPTRACPKCWWQRAPSLCVTEIKDSLCRPNEEGRKQLRGKRGTKK